MSRHSTIWSLSKGHWRHIFSSWLPGTHSVVAAQSAYYPSLDLVCILASQTLLRRCFSLPSFTITLLWQQSLSQTFSTHVFLVSSNISFNLSISFSLSAISIACCSCNSLFDFLFALDISTSLQCETHLIATVNGNGNFHAFLLE